jgi:hypothetical protein
MGIDVALLLAVAAPATAPAQAVSIPLAADPVLAVAQARLKRPVITWAFTAPTRSPDLRELTAAPPRSVTKVNTDPPRLAFAPTPHVAIEEARFDALVHGDPGAQMTGQRIRRPNMAAGLSLRVVQADGVLSPLLGMSGPVGKALTRIAVEAAQPQ